MLSWAVWLSVFCAWAGPSSDVRGTITGVVINGSMERIVVPFASVVLRARHSSELVPVAETTADGAGRFEFSDLPLDEDLVYCPGANLEGIHYPGRDVRLSISQPTDHQRLVVFETVGDPCPLVVQRHDIDVQAQTGMLQVTETLMVSNPTLRSYVGVANQGEEAPVTLRLSIPPEFDRVTFEKEFFGRQFRLAGQGIETQIPWTPGEREVKFTYRLPLESVHFILHRPLDLPTACVHVSVSREAVGRIGCNLVEDSTAGEDRAVFASDGAILPRGFGLRIELGELPIPWISHARWGAVALLLLVVLAAAIAMRQRSQPQIDSLAEQKTTTAVHSRSQRNSARGTGRRRPAA